jgi:hypothetical protein
MLRTYKAVLRGDRIEWVDRPPRAGKPVPVHVTLLEEEANAASTTRGSEMARILTSLAEAGGISAVPDPSEWQREMRSERRLADRGD